MAKKLLLLLALTLFAFYGFSQSNPAAKQNADGIPKEIILGIVIFIVCEILALVFKKWFIPYLESWKYDGIDLSGTWSEKYEAIYDDEKEVPNKQEQDIILKIVHKGKSITGTAELRDNNFTEDKVGDREFKIIKGYIKDGYITLILEIVSSTKIGAIAYLLKIQAEGDILKGLSIYYNSGNERISPAKSVLKRKRIQ